MWRYRPLATVTMPFFYFFIFYIKNIYYVNKSISHIFYHFSHPLQSPNTSICNFLQLSLILFYHFSHLLKMASSSPSSSFSKIEQIKRNYAAYNSICSMTFSILKTIVDEEETSTRPRKTRKVINRQREDAHLRLMKDYFDDDCVFDEGAFRRRFWMSK